MRLSSLAFLAALSLALTASACGKVKFDLTQEFDEQRIPAAPMQVPLPDMPLFEIPLKVDVDAATKTQGVGGAKSANLTGLAFSITAPDGAVFDFLDSITLKLKADGLDDVDIATLSPVPAQGTIALVPNEDVDILPYITQGSTLTAIATGRTPIMEVRFKGRAIITIHVA